MELIMLPLIAGYAAGSIPSWTKWAVATAALAGVFHIGYSKGAEHTQAKWNADKAERANQALEASQEARRIEQKRAAGVQEAQDHAQAIASASRADANSARTELDRLRDALAERNRIASAPGSQCRIDVGAVERKLLQSCAQEYQRMAESADEQRARLIELQGWARAIRD